MPGHVLTGSLVQGPMVPNGPGPHTLLPVCPAQITELRQKLAAVQKQVTELEAEREQKQRDFDRKLLLAKSKIEMEEASDAMVPLTWAWALGRAACPLTPPGLWAMFSSLSPGLWAVFPQT